MARAMKRYLILAEASLLFATAVDEQQAATSEIARTVGAAAAGSREVRQSIREVTTAARQTSDVATGLLDSSRDVSDRASAMRASVESLLVDIKQYS
jgi:methyl-accepting chemotaxis protein